MTGRRFTRAEAVRLVTGGYATSTLVRAMARTIIDLYDEIDRLRHPRVDEVDP